MTPAFIPPKRRVSFLSGNPWRISQKGMVSYRIGFSECEHGRASYRQHARKRLFNESHPACQEQNSHQFGKPNFTPVEGANMTLDKTAL
jgi:hypothetical protein